MLLLESAGIAGRNLVANKLRSGLTMLGMVIGIAAVIALLSIGYGFEQHLTQQFQNLGTNVIFIIPGRIDKDDQASNQITRQKPILLTTGDAEAISWIPDVVAVAPEISKETLAVREQNETITTVQGVTPSYQIVRNFRPILGEFIRRDHVDQHGRVAVLGNAVVNRLFKKGEYPIGQTIRLNGMPFRVIGVLAEKGGSALGNEDDVILIPISTAQKRLFNAPTIRGERVISIIQLQVTSRDKMPIVVERAKAILRERRQIQIEDADDFTVISQGDLLKVVGRVTAGLTAFLGTIAGISLLVGGIGIMNIMLVSVTERTREIGIRKAIGATHNDILSQFLIEAMLLSLLGGLIGISLGWTIAGLAANWMDEIKPVVTLQAVLLATTFAISVGLFFGIYPAIRAAKLNPIEALRYE